MSDTYVPGVCNIGPAEIARRKRLGAVAAAGTVALAAPLVLLPVPRPWRLLVAVPAAGAAVGYLQAALRFCARFGMAGLFNVAGDIGDEEEVWQQEYRVKDQRKAVAILAGSIGIGAAAAALVMLLPRRR